MGSTRIKALEPGKNSRYIGTRLNIPGAISGTEVHFTM